MVVCVRVLDWRLTIGKNCAIMIWNCFSLTGLVHHHCRLWILLRDYIEVRIGVDTLNGNMLWMLTLCLVALHYLVGPHGYLPPFDARWPRRHFQVPLRHRRPAHRRSHHQKRTRHRGRSAMRLCGLLCARVKKTSGTIKYRGEDIGYSEHIDAIGEWEHM